MRSNEQEDPLEEPAERDRSYYRHVKTGDRGYIVVRAQAKLIKLDRPNEEVLRPYRATEWVPDTERRPLTRAHVAQIAHAADVQLCQFIGMVEESKTIWQGLDEETRVQRISGNGPHDPPIRGTLYNRIYGLMKDFAR